MSVNREPCIHGVGAVVTGLAWGWLLGTVAPAVRYLGRSEPTVHTTELRNTFRQQMATPPWSYDLMDGIRKEVLTALEFRFDSRAGHFRIKWVRCPHQMDLISTSEHKQQETGH